MTILNNIDFIHLLAINLFVIWIRNIVGYNLLYLFCIHYGAVMSYNNLCIPESFNSNISHQLFYYTITFVNSFDDRFGMTNSINKHERLRLLYKHNTNFQPLLKIDCIRQTKSESKIYITGWRFLGKWSK